jgi:putative transposase
MPSCHSNNTPVVMPEHLHCLWQLPEGDSDYATRWSHIKSSFSRRLPITEPRNHSRIAKRERGIWQRRYWEHLIRDERDYRAHVHYIHNNPVKHGYVTDARDWPYGGPWHRGALTIIDVDWSNTTRSV